MCCSLGCTALHAFHHPHMQQFCSSHAQAHRATGPPPVELRREFASCENPECDAPSTETDRDRARRQTKSTRERKK